MAGGYILCEYEDVKKEFPEFRTVMRDVKEELLSRAQADWGIPREKFTLRQGYVTSIIPSLFADINGNRMATWDQWFNATGHQMIISGVATGRTIPEDYKVGLVGLAFLDKTIRISEMKMQISDKDKTIRISEMKMQISDKKLPRINIEEAFAYNQPAIIFEEGYILDEERSFELYAYILTQGPQRIKLIGLQANRVKDKVLTNTGAALE